MVQFILASLIVCVILLAVAATYYFTMYGFLQQAWEDELESKSNLRKAFKLEKKELEFELKLATDARNQFAVLNEKLDKELEDLKDKFAAVNLSLLEKINNEFYEENVKEGFFDEFLEGEQLPNFEYFLNTKILVDSNSKMDRILANLGSKGFRIVGVDVIYPDKVGCPVLLTIDESGLLSFHTEESMRKYGMVEFFESKHKNYREIYFNLKESEFFDYPLLQEDSSLNLENTKMTIIIRKI